MPANQREGHKGISNLILFDSQPANFDSFASWLSCIKRMLGSKLMLYFWSKSSEGNGLFADFSELWIYRYRSTLLCMEYSLFSTRHLRRETASFFAITGAQRRSRFVQQ